MAMDSGFVSAEAPEAGAAFDTLEEEVNAFPATPEATDTEVDTAVAAISRVYFVRVPRPPFNDEQLKKLQVSFQEQVARLKVMNAKMGVKRVSKQHILCV
jgi:hypothetical protein